MAGGEMTARLASLGAAALIVVIFAACELDRDVPVEQIGEPLAVNPSRRVRPSRPARDSGAAADDGPRRSRGADAAPAPPLDADSPDDPLLARPQPAKALALAAEADRQAASGELTKAMELYGRALEINPRSPWFLASCGWFLARQGQEGRARDALEQALDLEQRRDPLLLAALHLGIGELRELRGDQIRARESYRIALRTLTAPHFARALLRITPPTDAQHDAALRVAFPESAPPPELRRRFESGPRLGPRPIAYARDGDDRHLILTAQPPPDSGPLAAGAHYALQIIRTPGGEGDADDPSDVASDAPLSLGETQALRWHDARLAVVELGPERQALISTIERTAPGVGAPLEVGTTIVALDERPPRILFTRVTGQERDDPLGCRRGWREEVALHDSDGDGEIDAVTLTRRDTVSLRLEAAESYCAPTESTQPPRSFPLLPRPAAATEPPLPPADAAPEPRGQ
jgi:tetratricopeptide (TPR) repeat protein